MKKTRFFYEKIILMMSAAAWLLLLSQAYFVNMGKNPDEIESKTEERTVEPESGNEKEEEPSSQDALQQPDSQSVISHLQEPLIRVLLTDTDFQNYYHPFVTAVVQGKEVEYTPDSPEFSDNRVKVVLDGGTAGICMESISRQEGHPLYQGTLEITKTDKGLLLVNELPLETYLESVVPSEMPSSYEKDALKAQAVCARTYACKQIQEGKLREYGADVDDSVSYQVYGNIAPQENTSLAVAETKGQVMTYNGELIQAYYFSTSSGMTSTDEIWGAEEAASYLKSVECSFDSSMPWSRWKVTIPWSALQERSSRFPKCSGELINMEIVKKSQSGAVTGLRIHTEGGSHDLTEEYSIREFLSPKGCMIEEKNGAETEGGNLLPSAYFTMEPHEQEDVSISGGGYGHGVGMSQNGANEMAKEGYTYEEILNYFFRDISLQLVGDVEKEQ